MASITKRVSKTGRVTYQARARRRGYPLECKTFASRQEAKDWAAGVEGEMAQNRYLVDKDSRRVTLEEVIDEYLERRVPKLKGDQPKFQTLDWKKRPLAKRIIGTITAADVIEWMDKRLKEQVDVYQRDLRGRIKYGPTGRPLPNPKARQIAPKTVLNELRRLSAIFSWAQSVLEMHALVNPVKLIPSDLLPKARGRDRRLKKGELEQLLAAAKHDEQPLIGPIILFAIETACRRGEIAKLRLRDYNADAQTLDVRGTKNGDDRTIGLSPRAIQILEAIIQERGLTDPDAFFFLLMPDEISFAFRRCCRVTEIDGRKVEPIGDRLDFDGLVFHDLRHEGASLLFELGLKIQEVAHQTGHKSYQSLKRYTHPKGSEIAKKLAEARAGAAGDD